MKDISGKKKIAVSLKARAHTPYFDSRWMAIPINPGLLSGLDLYHLVQWDGEGFLQSG